MPDAKTTLQSYSVVVLGLDLEMTSRTNFEFLALKVQSLVLRDKSLVNSPRHLRATQTMTRKKLRLHATVSLIALSL